MTPLFPNQAVTVKGDLPSRELVEIIQRLIVAIEAAGGGGGGPVSWGSILGTLSSQADLQAALNLKANTASLAAIATSGAIADLSVNDGSAATPAHTFTSDTDTGLYLASPNTLGVSAGGANKMTVNGTGVFVNNTSGSDPFEVTADTFSSAFTVRGRAADNIATASFYDNGRTTRYGYLQGTSTKMRFGSETAIPLELLTGNTARVTLGTAGEIGLGSGVANGIQGDTLTSGGTGASPAWGGAEYWIAQEATYTLTSTTAAQKLFNATANGALTLPVGTYEYEALLYLTAMSATSGNGSFRLAGTATLASALSQAFGQDAAIGAGAAQGGSYWTGANSNAAIVTAGVATALGVSVRGMFRVSVAGTVIPSIALTTASAAIVQPNSYFIVKRRDASATAVSFGPWS